MKNHLFVLLLLFSVNAFAALNKWVDAEGKVHYSDQEPPANVQAKTLRSVSGPAQTPDVAGAVAQSAKAGSAPVAAKTYVEKEAELKRAQLAKKEVEAKAAQQQAAAEAKAANCAAAQKNLRTFEGMPLISDLDANGERFYLTDGQRLQRIETARQTVSSVCK